MTAIDIRDVAVGDGEMAALIRELDWAGTPLGPVEQWSSALRNTVRFLLAQRFPMILWWGPKYVQFYNDAYRPVPGTKHPQSMGQPAAECWTEIWPIIGPLIDTPFNGGPATWMEDILLQVNRHGYVEETHFTIAYSPVPDDDAPRGIGGVLGTVHEITDKVIGERRVRLLRDLGARAADARTAEEACEIAAGTLGKHDQDVPFALLYLLDSDGSTARLAGAAGIGERGNASPPVVRLEDSDAEAAEPAGWPFAAAVETGKMQTVNELSQRIGEVPRGPWPDPPHTAVVLPVPSTTHRVAALLVVGISSRLKLDEQYQGFLEIMTTQIATAIANARSYEDERERAEALADLDRAKTTFFSNVSHEFRTPLTLMIGPTEDALASAGRSLNGEDLETVYRNELRLLKLVNSLLDFSRIEAGRMQASYEPVDLAALTADLASAFRSTQRRTLHRQGNAGRARSGRRRQAPESVPEFRLCPTPQRPGRHRRRPRDRFRRDRRNPHA